MRTTRRQFLGLAAAGSLPLAGCGGDSTGGDKSPTETEDGTGTPTDGNGESPTSATVVEMTNTSFDPLRAEVDPGGTVEWVNRDGFDHDVTAASFTDAAADWSFSETLGSDERTTYTFEEAGVYEYYCTIHGKSNMCGAVLVGDVTHDASLPCEDGGGAGGGGY